MNVKGHIRYRTADNRIVVGVTTVVGQIAKPALIKWANMLGLDGTDSGKYTDDTAEIGTLAHSLITDGLQGRMTNFSGYDQTQQDAAEWCVKSWDAWCRGRDIKPILLEAPLVSERYRYGGTLDLFAEVDGIKTLIDLKSTNDIWPEHFTQVSAYRQLLIEAGHTVDAVRILNIPRARTAVFKEAVLGDEVLEKNFEIFTSLLKVYQIRKELKYV
ncbi:MAG: hypothetical protein ABIL62_13990 [Planctomycetota bacterium]